MKKLISLLAIAMLIGSFGVCRAEDLEPMPNPPIIIEELEPTSSTTGSITLTEGWNLVAMPVLPAEPYTVEQFIKEVESPIKPIPIILKPLEELEEEGASIEEKNGERCIVYPKSYWKVALVAVYKNGRFERYPKEGVSYNMVPGEAYFVYATYTGPRPLLAIGPNGEHREWHPKTSVKIIGRPLDVPVSLNLNRGWNGASIFEGDLQRLSDELTEQYIKAKKIAFWSAEKQEWEQYELPIVKTTITKPEIPYEDGHSYPLEYDRGKIEIIRPIKADEGFFLLCNENGLYIPSLNMKPETPVPPDPPEPPVIDKVGLRITFVDDFSDEERIAALLGGYGIRNYSLSCTVDTEHVQLYILLVSEQKEALDQLLVNLNLIFSWDHVDEINDEGDYVARINLGHIHKEAAEDTIELLKGLCAEFKVKIDYQVNYNYTTCIADVRDLFVKNAEELKELLEENGRIESVEILERVVKPLDKNAVIERLSKQK